MTRGDTGLRLPSRGQGDGRANRTGAATSLAAAAGAAAALALVWLVTVLASATALAEPDRDDIREAQQRLQEIEERHQSAVEEYLQAQSRLDELDQEITAAENRLQDLSARADQQADGAEEVVRDLYAGRSAASAAALLDASDAAEAGRRAAYLRFAERNHRATLEQYRATRVELDRETDQLQTARAEAAELREELEARAARIDSQAQQQQEEIASLRQQVAEREARERRARERRARERAERQARERAERQQVASRESGGQASQSEAPESSSEPDTADEPAEPEPARSEPAEQEAEPTAAPSPSNAAATAVEAAMSKRGSPYQWGAQGPDRFDCSGLSMWAWNQAGVNIPRTSRQQYAALPNVSRSELRPGDLVFFGDPIHHLGIYIGDGQMVEAPYTGEVVRVNDINRDDYAGAARPGG